ncbi:hypothetical protein B566_EDAN014885 [Ephemera danica]|nr:hypothetical protein B566_EDAN014885 [Ephemera danica]
MESPLLAAEMQPSAPVVCASLPPTSEQHNLIWCSDLEFDAKVNHLSVAAVLDLVQALQAAMVLEQQTFDSLRQQLAQATSNSEAHERLSTALCSIR